MKKIISNKYFLFILIFLYDYVAFAHDCSTPGDCEETAGYNAAVAITGGLIALGVGLMTSWLPTQEPDIDENNEDLDDDLSEDEDEGFDDLNEEDFEDLTEDEDLDDDLSEDEDEGFDDLNEEDFEDLTEDEDIDDDLSEDEDENEDETEVIDDDDDLRVEDEEQKRLEEERLKAEVLATIEAERQRKEFESRRELEIQKQQEEREKALQKLKEIEKEKKRREKYINKLCKKYNTTPSELRNVLRKNIKMSQAEADSWNSYDKKLAIAETAAKMTLIAADTAIDGLANATGPMGRGIRAGYKITKSVASTMATKGVSGSSLASGLVTGGADAATDFIENPYLKAGTTIVGETIGGAITDGKKGAVDGFVKGVFTAGVNEGTGRLAGPGYGNDMKKMIFNKDGTATVTIKSAGKWISKTISGKNAIKFANGKIYKQFVQSGVKGTSATINEMAIKPALGL